MVKKLLTPLRFGKLLLGVGFALFTGFFVSLCFVSPAAAQNNDGRLGTAAQHVRQHANKIRDLEQQFESHVKQMTQQAREDAVKEKYKCLKGNCEGAEKHPWIKANEQTGANPNSEKDYIEDSLILTDGQTSVPHLYSCWEPKLLAKGKCGGPHLWATPDLGAACMLSCPCNPPWPLIPDIPCIRHHENAYEVIEYWWPEHQIYINNYGVSRLDPTQQQSPKGQKFTRQALLQQKDKPEKTIKQELEKNYPLDLSKLKLPDREQPRKGQSATLWGGFPSINTVDAAHAHGARTRVAYRTANARPNTCKGWTEEKKSIFDAFPPPTNKKDILNIWTEYGAWDEIDTVPQLSAKIGERGKKAMKALFGDESSISDAAKKKKPFWQSQGAAAYRAQKWQDPYGPMKDILQLNGGNDPTLKEVVYKGGQELWPMTLNVSGFTSPPLASAAIFARRGFYMMGTKDLLKYHPDGEKGRMNEYTILNEDKSREIDKMQLLWPRVTERGSECFRSQRIPNMVDSSEYPWIAQNLPPHVISYVKKDFGDVTFAYWNKRVACSCRKWSYPWTTGSWTMNFPSDGLEGERGSGDRPYGKFEKELCYYDEKKREIPSAFAGKDRPMCTGSKGNYWGIDDKV